MPSLIPTPDSPWDFEEHADLACAMGRVAASLPDLAAKGFTADATAPRPTLAQVSDCVTYLTAVKATAECRWKDDGPLTRHPIVIGTTSGTVAAAAERWFREVMREDVRIAHGAMILALVGWGYLLRRTGRGVVVVSGRILTPRRPTSWWRTSTVPWWMRKSTRVRQTGEGAVLRVENLVRELLGRLQAGSGSDAQDSEFGSRDSNA